MFPANAVDIRAYATGGIAEDLGKYLDSDNSILTRDMLFENVVDVFTIDDVLVTIPNRFIFKAYTGLRENLGEGGGWTVDEVINLLMDNDDLTIHDFSIDTDEFFKILDFVKSYEAPAIDYTRMSKERVDDGKVLAEAVQLMNMDDIAYWTADERYTMKGYPNAGGEVAYGIMVSDAFCINSNSEHKEAAWNYIQYIVMSLSYDDVADGLIRGFPTVISQYEKVLDISTKSHQEGYVIPESAKEQFTYLLNNTRYIAGWDNDVVMQVVDEEIINMLTDNRSVSDTIGIIQNRVQLYLDERK